MTSDEIIKKAKEEDSIELLDFIKLAILQEREECAKIADEFAKQTLEHNFSALIANNIRTRKSYE